MQFPDRASRLRRPRPTGSAGPPAEAFPVPSPTGSIALHLPLISSQPDSFLPCVDIYHTGFGYVYLFKGHYTSDIEGRNAHIVSLIWNDVGRVSMMVDTGSMVTK